MSGAAALDADVIVVGLGPVGATLAGLLADHGVRVLALERSREVYPLPRAAHVDHEVMRVFQRLGVAEAMSDSLRPAASYAFRTAAGETLLQFDAHPASPSGWASGYMIHQPGVERALRDKLGAAANVAVRLGAEVTDVRQTAGSVTALIEADGGSTSAVARYLIACDGASSPIRETSGIGLHDLGFDEQWLVIDALATADAALPTLNLQICDPARPTTSALMPAGRHRWEFMLRAGETAETAMDDAFIQELLRPWSVGGGVTVERKAVYRFHGLIADRWRAGRVLLAGDAAHQMPPFAGQGLCSGVRDAANLAWKLAAVLAGRASPDVLDTYQTERAPHVRAYVDLAIGMGRIVCILDPEQAQARNAAMLAQRASGPSALPSMRPPVLGPGLTLAEAARPGAYFPQPWALSAADGLRLDDVLGPGAWLIHRGPRPGATAARLAQASVRAFDVAGETLAPFAAALSAWLDAAGADAVLVRPDRYVFGAAAPERLLAAYGAAMRPPACEAA